MELQQADLRSESRYTIPDGRSAALHLSDGDVALAIVRDVSIHGVGLELRGLRLATLRKVFKALSEGTPIELSCELLGGRRQVLLRWFVRVGSSVKVGGVIADDVSTSA